MPETGVLVSSGDVRGKVDMLDACRLLDEHGYKIYATEGTAKFLNNNGIRAQALLTNARLAGAYVKAFLNKPVTALGITPWQEYK